MLLAALFLFLVLGAYQLQLPGLHYDEAKEAGLNAMQLLLGQPVTAFRDATVQIGPWRFPLMVQDYIGALNVALAIPFLAVGGINPVALRWLPLTIGALTLICTWHVARRLGGTAAAVASVMLLAVNPSFVFWSRQGIFVTNLTALLFMASLWTGLRWWQEGRPRDLWLTALLWGLGLYAKLLFIWALGALSAVALLAWALTARARTVERRSVISSDRRGTKVVRGPSTWALAAVAFLLPLTPLILFNLRTGGTLISVLGNLGRSYYGVENAAYLANLGIRLTQVAALLRGDHFWYLGQRYANPWAVWLATALLALAALGWARSASREGSFCPPFLLSLAWLGLMVAQSAFTVSDLFITHYAILLPLVPLTAGLAFAITWQNPRSADFSRLKRLKSLLPGLALLAVLAWAGTDAWTTVRYHRILAITGGYNAHSEAINRLAAYLDEKGYTAPVMLDWGIDAPVRFLTAGRVKPIEVFGYDRLDAPDPGFAARVADWLNDNNTVFVGPAPEKAVFRGRVEAMAALASQHRRLWLQEAWFLQRSGEVLFVIYRSIPQG
ncbi:MAG: ArnT family glycosyltransferase [Anaerolineae bacterium]